MLVNNKGNYSYEAEGVVLIPGTNMVEEEDFDKFISHPLMAKLDEQGEFVYERGGKSSAKDMIALAKDTFDLEVLETMREEESRATVLKAIDEQIAELQGDNE